MSIDFNGTTSKLEHTTADLSSTLMTFCVWALADGLGENSFGAILRMPEGIVTDTRFLIHNNNANNLRYSAKFASSAGVWTFPATDGQWNAVALSMDHSSDANNPIARVNFASATVTETSIPSGAEVTPATGYCIGNETLQTRTWNGALQHLQVFNVILTSDEMDMALRCPGMVRRGLILWMPMLNAAHVEDWSGSVLNGTATDLADRDSAPCAPIIRARHGWRGAFTAAAAFDAATFPHLYSEGMVGRVYV